MLKAIVTGGFSGLSPVAPGTIGTVAACLLWYLLGNSIPFFSTLLGKIALAVFTTLSGYIACKYYLERFFASESHPDPGEIVIDEWAGVFVALCVVSPTSHYGIVLAFILFRIFDIMKPWPIKKFEQLPGALGIMIDDIIAGVFALLLFLLIQSLAFPIELSADTENTVDIKNDFTVSKDISLEGRLAFTATIYGDKQILALDLKSGKVRTLVNSSGNDWYPSFNHAGNKLAFVSDRDGEQKVYYADWDGENQLPLTKNSRPESDPHWSSDKDSEKIVFYREQNGPSHTHIYSYDFATKRETRLTNSPSRNSTPKISPNGEEVAFSTNRNWPGWDVCILNTSTLQTKCVLKGVDSYCRPAWSPDGGTLAYSYGSRKNIRIGTIAINSKKQSSPVQLDGKSYDPTYRKDGKQIFFSNDKDGSFDIYYLEFRKDPIKLISSRHTLRFPSWHPNNTMQQEVLRLKNDS